MSSVIRKGEYVQFRRINKRKEIEVSEEFFDDLEKIINGIRKKGVNFDMYEIHIILRGKGVVNHKSDDCHLLFEIFEEDPSVITSELDAKQIIDYIKEHKDDDYYPYMENFFKMFIAVNHENDTNEFEEEYDIDMSNFDSITNIKLCEIANNEIDWMGLDYEFIAFNNNSSKEIWCQKRMDL